MSTPTARQIGCTLSTKRSKASIDNSGMEPHLLRLPGELRNRIFEYALNIDDGTCYREDQSGVGWLCLYPKGSEGGVEEEGQNPAAIVDVGVADGEAPARKRRKITETYGVINKSVFDIKEMIRPAQVTVNGHVVANQLQFVNHQLRSETRALVIRYNDIHIIERSYHLTEFIYSVVGHKRLWIQKISQRVEVSGLTILRDLKLDEEMHPRFMIHMHLPLARMERNHFFMAALHVQQSGRRHYSFVGRITQSIAIQQALLNVPSTTYEIPSYVKVFPWDREFDEGAIRRYCEEDGIEQKLLIPTSPGGIENMVAISKEWFENGY